MKHSVSTRDLVFMAAGAALIAVCAWISVPTAVPFTMQTFAVFFLTALLGGSKACVSVLIYLLLGAAGVPVFAHFTSGIGILFGNTGGYMLGFLLIPLIHLLAVRLFGKKILTEVLALLTGLAVCYAFGTAWFLYLYTQTKGAVAVGTVLGWCVYPFILPDIVKLGMAVVLARRVAPALEAARAS